MADEDTDREMLIDKLRRNSMEQQGRPGSTAVDPASGVSMAPGVLTDEPTLPLPSNGNTGVNGGTPTTGRDPNSPFDAGNAGGGTVGAGYTSPLDPSAVGLDPASKAAAAAPAASYNMRGFDAGKMAADPSQQSEKYKIGNIFKKYDPKGGVTPEMLAELNALGIAEFSGAGDKLSVNNTKNDPRFGKGGTADVVYGLKGQNADTAWQPWFMDEGAAPGAGAAAAAPGMGGMGLPTPGGGMPSLAPTDSDFFRRLMEKAQQGLGGQQAFDREALLKMLGA